MKNYFPTLSLTRGRSIRLAYFFPGICLRNPAGFLDRSRDSALRGIYNLLSVHADKW